MTSFIIRIENNILSELGGLKKKKKEPPPAPEQIDPCFYKQQPSYLMLTDQPFLLKI